MPTWGRDCFSNFWNKPLKAVRRGGKKRDKKKSKAMRQARKKNR